MRSTPLQYLILSGCLLGRGLPSNLKDSVRFLGRSYRRDRANNPRNDRDDSPCPGITEVTPDCVAPWRTLRLDAHFFEFNAETSLKTLFPFRYPRFASVLPVSVPAVRFLAIPLPLCDGA